MSVPLLRITGTDPYQLGTQHGKAFAADIRAFAAIRKELLANQLAGWSPKRIDRLCDDQLAALAARWPKVLEEMKGISDATQLSMRDLTILNGYTDLKDFADSEPADRIDEGCSVFSIKGPHINGCGQTWDMHASAEPYLVLLDFVDLPVPVRVFTLTGCLGLCGVNAAGVNVNINNLSCRETNRGGLVWNGLVRMMLEQRTARAAIDVVHANLPTSGHHYLASDEREAISIETTGRRIDEVGTVAAGKHGMLVHTNHYLGKLATEEVTSKLSETTRPRLAALEAYRAEHALESITRETLERDFLDCGPLCERVFLATPATPHAGATCGGMMVDYASRTAFVFRGRYAAAKRVAWRF